MAGCVGHMTVDEILERSIDGHADLSCPACGRIHLNREEIDLLEQDLIVHSDRYRALCLQAVAGTHPAGPIVYRCTRRPRNDPRFRPVPPCRKRLQPRTALRPAGRMTIKNADRKSVV